MTTVAVTGASGHLGCNLVRALVASGRDVRALIHRSGASLDGALAERVRADTRDPASLERAFDGVDVVYHLAARISIGEDDPREVRAVNVEGTRNVAAACLARKVRRLVHVASIHALSPWPADQVVDETRTLSTKPSQSIYDLTKAEGLAAVEAAVARGLDAVSVLPSAILGPRDYAPSRMGRVILDLATGRLPALVAGGFDWVDVRDVVAGALAAERKGRRGERYLLSGKWEPVSHLAALVARASGRKAPGFVCPMGLARAAAPFALAWSRIAGTRPLFTPQALFALRHHVKISHAKAEAELGYAVRPLEETVRDTVAWFREAGMLEARA